MSDSPRVHNVKTWPQFFQDQLDEFVSFQLRYNMDRNYQKGDVFIQHEFLPTPGSTVGTYTGRVIHSEIGYVTSGYGLAAGFVALQLIKQSFELAVKQSNLVHAKSA